VSGDQDLPAIGEVAIHGADCGTSALGDGTGCHGVWATLDEKFQCGIEDVLHRPGGPGLARLRPEDLLLREFGHVWSTPWAELPPVTVPARRHGRATRQ
jgi:hypothetical protein